MNGAAKITILILKPNWQDIGKYFLLRIMDDDNYYSITY